ncbi:MAG: hypothetical protein KJ061_00945 [Vicinamibacteraceae bacterium]|nr:hypothetical protein [Vicinamibacteraceae bacterium]
MTTTWVVILVSALLLSGCANRAYKRGLEAARAMDWDAAVAHLTKAVQESPDRADYRIQLERAMIEASRVHFDRARAFEAADNLEAAVLEYRKTIEYDPSNRQAMLKAAELDRTLRDRAEAARPKPAIETLRERARQQSQPPLINPASRAPISMTFEQATTQDILKAIGEATGINIAFERDFRPQTTSIRLDDVTLEDALNQVLTLNQLWYKVINSKTILIIPDTQQKRAQYEDQVVRTFYISHADPQELSQSVSLLTRIAGVAVPPVVSVSKTANTITVRGTRGMVEIIDSIIRANDKPRAEIVIDVEILEVNRTRAKDYGLNLSQYQIGTIFSPESAPDSDGGSAPFNLNTITRGISAADFYMTVPSAVVKFLASDSMTRQIAKPQLRGTEGTKLTLNLGDEIPVPSTTFLPFATGGAASNPLTSFTYRSVGVNVEMTPRVTYEDEIVLDIFVESSNLGDSVTIAGQSLPSFGSRKVSTRLRLREGESNLLAGLMREDDRRSLRGIPGIMNMPILRQLLSANEQSISQTDIVMLLTPRIVRTHELTEADLAPIHIGSQQNIGLTGTPQLFAPPEMPPAEGAPAPAVPPGVGPAPVTPLAPPASPTGAAPAGAQPPPAAAPAGAPAPGTAAPTGAQSTRPPGAGEVRVPEGATPRPTVPPGSSPVPGTTTAPPAAPVEPSAPSEATRAAQLILSPPGTEFSLTGGPYTVPISLANASRVSVVTVTLLYDPARLRVRAVQEGSFLRQGGVQVTFTQNVDAAAGRVDISATRTGDTTGASGAGLLAAVLFEPVAAGEVTLAPSAVVTNAQGIVLPVAASPVSITVR